jgi:hypothetical protein
MLSSSHLQTCFPIGTKYVLEGRGRFVHRYVEFPSGCRIELATRKAMSCKCGQRVDIVPGHIANGIDRPARRQRIHVEADEDQVRAARGR